MTDFDGSILFTLLYIGIGIALKPDNQMTSLYSYAAIAEDARLATEASSMSPKQYKQIIEQLGLSQERAGEWLGVSARTGQNYAAKGPPEPVAKLLRLMIKHGFTPEDVK